MRKPGTQVPGFLFERYLMSLLLEFEGDRLLGKNEVKLEGVELA